MSLSLFLKRLHTISQRPFSCMSLRAIVRIAVARSSLSPRAQTFKVLPTMSLVLPHLNTVPYPIKPRTGHPPTAREIGSSRKSAKDCPETRRCWPIARDRTLDRSQRLLVTEALLVRASLFTICNPPCQLIIMLTRVENEIAGKNSP